MDIDGGVLKRRGLRAGAVRKGRVVQQTRRRMKAKAKKPALPRARRATNPISPAQSTKTAPKTTNARARTKMASPTPVARLAGPKSAGPSGTTTPQSPRSEEQASDLQHTMLLLDKIFYRNRNQHRAQHWWKFLGLLRKAIKQLDGIDGQLLGLAGNLEKGKTADAVHKRLEKEKALEHAKEEVKSWIREVLLPRCYVAFSGVVADGSFCAVGVVLMGVLGAVGTLVGLPKERLEVESFRGIRVKETGGERMLLEERVYGKGERESESESERQVGKGEDVGEVVERVDRGVDAPGATGNGKTPRKSKPDTDFPPINLPALPPETGSKTPGQRELNPVRWNFPASHAPVPKSAQSSTQSNATTTLESPAAETKKKKKRKKTNAIDDLFGDLA